MTTTITAGETYVRRCNCTGECRFAWHGHLYRVERFVEDAQTLTSWLALVVGLTGPDEGRWVVYGGGQFVSRFERVEVVPDVPAVLASVMSPRPYPPVASEGPETLETETGLEQYW